MIMIIYVLFISRSSFIDVFLTEEVGRCSPCPICFFLIEGFVGHVTTFPCNGKKNCKPVSEPQSEDFIDMVDSNLLSNLHK